MAKRNPLPSFDATADALHAELGAVLLEHHRYSEILFTVEEIRNFVDYCMAALQSCPESCREFVHAKWGKIEPQAQRGTPAHDQSFELEKGKIVPVIGSGVWASMGEVTKANVDLEWLWGEEFKKQFPEQVVKDSYVNSEPLRIHPREMLIGFVQALYDVEWRRLGRRGATRHDADVNSEIYSVIVEHFSNPRNIKAWCDEQDRPRDAFRWNAARHPGFVEYNTMAGVRAHPGDVAGNTARWIAVPVPWLIRYAQLIEGLLTLADELESAGWQPEPKSHRERDKLCVWHFTDGQHPGSVERVEHETPRGTVWELRWDNGGATGVLGTYATEEDAHAAGLEWEAEMMAATPGAEEGDYSFEVGEVEDPDG